MHNANHILVRRRNSTDSAWEEVLLSPSEFKKMLDTPEPKPEVASAVVRPAVTRVMPVPALASITGKK